MKGFPTLPFTSHIGYIVKNSSSQHIIVKNGFVTFLEFDFRCSGDFGDVGFLGCTIPDASMTEKHESWMAQYGRVYKDDAEKAKRFKIFKENVDYIESFNSAGARSYKLAVNQYADLTNDEFRASRNRFKMGFHQKSAKTISSFRYANITAVPSSVDWRKKGAVNGISILRTHLKLDLYTPDGILHFDIMKNCIQLSVRARV